MSIANLFRLGSLWIHVEHFGTIDIQLFCESEKVAVVISKVATVCINQE